MAFMIVGDNVPPLDEGETSFSLEKEHTLILLFSFLFSLLVFCMLVFNCAVVSNIGSSCVGFSNLGETVLGSTGF